MYTYQIEQFLEERNYIIKKASDLLKLIDVDISTQIKNVTFKPESNDYYIRTVDIVDGKPEERIFKFHVFTIEEYHNDCRTLGIIPEDLEETKPVIEQQEIIPFKQPTEVIPFKQPKKGEVAQFNGSNRIIRERTNGISRERANRIEKLKWLENYLNELNGPGKTKILIPSNQKKVN